MEQTLTARIGDAGKRLHTGRSRNDQVALDIRLTLRDYSHTLQAYIVELVRVLCKKAAENTTAVMPGYTHLQRAQPITFGHALMAYASMLLRDLQRFEDATARMDAQCPLGSGALAGTTYPLDRQFTAEKLGFAAPCANSLDLSLIHISTGNGRTPHGSSSASSRPRTSPSGWTCGATMSTTTGTGGISRLHITCRIFWDSSKTNPLRR